MMRLFPVFLGLLLLAGQAAPVWAASPKATALRQANGLVAFTPPASFLSGNFVAKEMNPSVIFGPVKNFAASRKCPTAWLIEKDQKDRLAGAGGKGAPMEYTLYLEEDCPDKVVYYVFVDQSGMTPEQWIAYRYKFHGRTKTEPEYGPTKSKLEKACQAKCGVGAELRFIQQNGELLNKSPEAVLLGEHYPAIYDLNRGRKISK
jgi:hypothetical protein